MFDKQAKKIENQGDKQVLKSTEQESTIKDAIPKSQLNEKLKNEIQKEKNKR